MKHIFTFLMVTVVMLSVVSAQKVGELVPDFTLQDLSDQKYKLSDNKGKVILVFLMGYNCTLCLASAPTVKSELTSAFSGNGNFQALVIDVWNGSKTAVQGFKDATNLEAIYLQKGSSVASSWSSTKDRLIVIDAEGKMVFKGTKAAKSDADDVKAAIQNALNNITTSVRIIEEKDGFSLKQNYPNPVMNQTSIEFSLGEPSDVALSVFDNLGKKVLVPVQQSYPAGDYKIYIKKNQLKRGIYFYRLETENFVSVKKMIFQ